MKMPRSRFIWLSARRRLCSGLVLFSYLATVFGYPLPASPSAGNQESFGQPQACGCSAEAQRSGNCCCSVRSGCPGCAGTSVAPEQKKSCCQPPTQPATNSTDPHKPGPAGLSNAPARLTWVLGVAAQGCQGLSTIWLTNGAATPPAPPVLWNPALQPMERLANSNTAACRLPVAPLDPPPRVS